MNLTFMFAENFISSMPGPLFLGFYLVFIVAVIVFGKRILRKEDLTRGMESLSVPENPNPYEIAYLRGGNSEVLRLAILELIQRGYLKPSGAEICIESNPPSIDCLDPFQRKVFLGVKSGMRAHEIFSSSLPTVATDSCAAFDKDFKERKLLHEPEILKLRWKVAWPAVILVASMGIYKLSVAISKGRRDIDFLMLMTFVGTISTGVIVYTALKRTTNLGQRYLKSLQHAFDQLRPESESFTTRSQLDPNLLLLASVFGTTILTGTAYAAYNEVFRESSSSSEGCSSCGSGSSCGSSGGSGGCGGGGCGGCGSS